MNIHLSLFSEMRVRDEHKQTAIREQAMELIVKNGFEGFSMQKLAKAAGVSPATIYIYFRNKEDLVQQLFQETLQAFAHSALKDFDPASSLEEGLWRQWKNRLGFILEHPVRFRFFEQFRHSSLVNHSHMVMNEFRDSMKRFLKNAVAKGELRKMEPELFWSLAYGPFFSLVRFHLSGKSMMSGSFRLSDTRLKQALKAVVRGLKPD
jgi:TetR/AcrR family transcriptional repressor of multidrug resistance operon